MWFWKDEERKSAGPSQENDRHWTEDEEFSSELVLDHIRRCYDREGR